MEGFTQLAPAIWLHEPPSSPSPPQLGQPSLVVLCTWVGAQPKHIARYTAQYRARYPAATLLVLESNLADMTYRTDSAQQTRLGPARHLLGAHVQDGLAGGRVLVHAFSNGGAQCATHVVAAVPPARRANAFCAFVFDSCPGKASYAHSANAILFPLAQSPVLKLAALPFVHLVLCLIFIADRFFSFENVVARARRRLNDTEYVDYAVPRLYIYSSADGMVPGQDIEDHAAQARHAGYSKVVSLHCEASRHCAHASKYPEQYWSAIGKLLDQSNDIKRE